MDRTYFKEGKAIRAANGFEWTRKIGRRKMKLDDVIIYWM